MENIVNFMSKKNSRDFLAIAERLSLTLQECGRKQIDTFTEEKISPETIGKASLFAMIDMLSNFLGPICEDKDTKEDYTSMLRGCLKILFLSYKLNLNVVDADKDLGDE